MKEKHTGRAIAGFFMSLFIFNFAIGIGFIGSLRFSIFNSSSFHQFLKHTKFYDIIAEVITDKMVSEADKIGLSEDEIRDLMTDERVVNVTNSIISSIEHDKDVDLTYLRSDITNYSKYASEPAVKELYDKYIVQLNENVNQSIQDSNKKYELKKYLRDFRTLLRVLKDTTAILLIGMVIFMMINFAVYHADSYLGFRHNGSVILAAGMIHLIVGGVGMALRGSLIELITGKMGDAPELSDALGKFAEYNLTSLFTAFMGIAGVMIVLGIVCLVVSAVLKKRSYSY